MVGVEREGEGKGGERGDQVEGKGRGGEDCEGRVEQVEGKQELEKRRGG